MVEDELVTRVSRRKAREAAMYIIFSAIGNCTDAAGCIDGLNAFLSGGRQKALQDSLAQNIVQTYDARLQEIEQWMQDSYERPLENMTMVERAIIAAAVAEMLSAPDTPYRVIIVEAIEIAATFGAEGGGSLVNGILHDIATRQRR